jgi:hypothetical protein
MILPNLPIWLWIVSVLGVIAAGIGLAYLIIFLFWKIEKYFSPLPEPKKEEVPQEDSPEIMEREIEEIPSLGNKFIRFADVLHSQFNHSFKTVTTIVCWDIALKHGEEVRDKDGNQMKLQVIQPKKSTERTRYLLVDKTGHQMISVVLGREYIKQETKLDLGMVNMVR